MSREIKFRGKRIDNGEWVYGYLADNNHIYSVELGVRVEINPETVGQYTGQKDRNSKEVFDGDIIRFWHINEMGEDLAVVFWSDGSSGFSAIAKKEDSGYWNRTE